MGIDFDWVKNFVFRFIQHIDRDASQVKSNFSARIFSFFSFFLFLSDWCTDILVAVAAIAFNPLFWNFAARNGMHVSSLRLIGEWNKRTLTQMFGNKYTGCYFLAAIIFILGIVRDFLYPLVLSCAFG